MRSLSEVFAVRRVCQSVCSRAVEMGFKNLGF